MPYRAAIQTVLHRCDELCARIEELQHSAVAREPCETLADALIWEARLRARVAQLEATWIEDDEIAPVTAVAEPDPSPATHASQMTLAIVLGVVVAIGVVVVFALTLAPARREVHVGRFALLAGNVVSARPPASVGDRCTIRIDRDGEACDSDAICPTVEKRWREDHCALRERVSFTTEASGTIEIELDAWR